MRHRITPTLLSLLLLAGCGDGSADDGAPAPDGDATVAAPATTNAPQSVGSITALFGGEDRTWTSLYREADGRVGSTSTYQIRTIGRREVHLLSLGGNMGVTMSTNGSLRVRAMFTSPLANCPCTVTTGILEYLDNEGAPVEASGASVTVDLFYENADGTFGVEGSFSGTLPAAGDEAAPVPIAGTFDIRRVVRVGPGA